MIDCYENIKDKPDWTSSFVQHDFPQLLEQLQQIVVGKPEVFRLACITMLCGGHLLLEGAPGVGKTLFARTLAQVTAADYRRLQMTPDMLPADVTGSMVFDPKGGELRYSGSPLDAHIVLADELNRASTRTQAALLEAMEEGTISVDGITRKLPEPFMLIATQNPLSFEGTYRLLEAELDRFLMRLTIEYPDPEMESDMLIQQLAYEGYTRKVRAVLTPEEWLLIRKRIRKQHVDAAICRYIVELVQATRSHADVRLGVSPRGSAALLRASQAEAFLHGRDYVIPADVQAVAVPVLAHRLQLRGGEDAAERQASIIQELLLSAPVPTFGHKLPRTHASAGGSGSQGGRKARRAAKLLRRPAYAGSSVPEQLPAMLRKQRRANHSWLGGLFR
ncbi:AAA family ATPase [Paenibacillus arenosi]|uniref:MoxR family ATPase n=1 Tax=Paenibacillus arenosi TaxID=2774142 RepID=A0ABR9B391_9BACL|nr:MoxR family ATPase [Paenibacillus arenosi]MBD8500836.1 MoxR family ATPase [Paenibacillus arenosi]